MENPTPPEEPKPATRRPRAKKVEAVEEQLSPRKVKKVEVPVQEVDELKPLFFVELGKTLKDLRKAERQERLSSLKIA